MNAAFGQMILPLRHNTIICSAPEYTAKISQPDGRPCSVINSPEELQFWGQDPILFVSILLSFMMQLTTALFALLVAAVTVVADPILQAPVNTPTLIQSFIVNPRFAPCLQVQGNYDGAPVIIANCGTFNGANEEWTVVQGGGVEGSGDPGPVTQIRIYGNKCLDVPNGRDQNGNKLQIWTCYDGNANQLWQVGDNGIKWASHNKCLDLTDGNLSDGTRVQIWTCGTPDSPNINQSWNAVPPR